MLTRRRLLAAGAGCALAALTGACGTLPRPSGLPRPGGDGAEAATLTARPGEVPGPPPEPGQRSLGVAPERDAVLHLPAALPPGRPASLVVTLHGAGGDAGAGLALLQPLADERGFALLAPASRGSTWDAVTGGFGVDVAVVDRALDATFRIVAVDPARIAVAGFSDGASYALGLGLANGDLFGHLLAFSPGSVPDGGRTGQPAVFVAHGVDDEVLPIDRTSDRIVPRLRDDGYDVTYRRFDGPHTLPPDVAREGVDWLGWSR